jgi:preprotein translocase subunit SecD
MIRVEKEPCMTEGHIKAAKVIDIVGGFAISVQLDRQGAWLFEQYTASNKGRRFPVICQWTTPPEKTLNTGRWLAAPKLTTVVSDGEFTFTPDATRDEAELIALGLNNVAKKGEAADRW